MEILDLLVRRILEVVPLTQTQLGYVFIGIGGLIILLVLIIGIASMFKKKAEPQSKFRAYAGRTQHGSQYSNALGGDRRVHNEFHSELQKVKPVGNFAPKNTAPSAVSSNLGAGVGTGAGADGLGGLSRLKAQAEFQDKSDVSQNTAANPTRPEGFVPVGYTASSSNSVKPDQPISEPKKQSFNNPSTPLSALDQGQKLPETKPNEKLEAQVKPKAPIDDRLLDYIRNTKSQGFSSSAIRSELIKVGWNPIEVDRAISEIGI